VFAVHGLHGGAALDGELLAGRLGRLAGGQGQRPLVRGRRGPMGNDIVALGDLECDFEFVTSSWSISWVPPPAWSGWQARLLPYEREQLLQATKAHLLAGMRTLEQSPPGGRFPVAHAPQAQKVRQVISLLFPPFVGHSPRSLVSSRCTQSTTPAFGRRVESVKKV
jgi:hypothetical protein